MLAHAAVAAGTSAVRSKQQLQLPMAMVVAITLSKVMVLRHLPHQQQQQQQQQLLHLPHQQLMMAEHGSCCTCGAATALRAPC
jgi:hypothetical protein